MENNARTYGNPISVVDAINIGNRIKHIESRVEPIMGQVLFPYTEWESNYLDSVRKRILENHELMIEIHSVSQESFSCSVHQKGASIAIYHDEDAYYYEQALIWAIKHALNIIIKAS